MARHAPRSPRPTVARGALLCEAFETYRALVGESQISFEHAVYLLGALHAGDELRVAHCRDCSGVLVTDRLALRIPVCNECALVPAVRAEARRPRPAATVKPAEARAGAVNLRA